MNSIGNDCSNLIMDYKYQLEHTENMKKIVKEVKLFRIYHFECNNCGEDKKWKPWCYEILSNFCYECYKEEFYDECNEEEYKEILLYEATIDCNNMSNWIAFI